jgi:hypothetical protein
MAETLRSAAGSAEFLCGLCSGLAALAIGLALVMAGRNRPVPTPLPVVGLLFAAGLAVGLQLTVGLPGEPAPGPWLSLLAAVAAVVVAVLLADFDDRWGHRGLGPALLAVSLAGVYATVPDTEMALVALGAVLPLTLLGWPRPLASLGRAGAWAAAGSLVWVVASGGAARGSAVVGGIACLGLLVVEPVARRLHPEHRSVLARLPDGRLGTPAAAAVQLGLVYVASRVAGTQPSVVVAAAIALAATVAAVAVALSATTTFRDRPT